MTRDHTRRQEMRTIEIRRHCATKKGPSRGRGSHLSPAGVAQARRIGAGLGPFDLVLASTVPRTSETALAMGFAVDDAMEVLGDVPPDALSETGHHDRWNWGEPFVRFGALVAQDGPTTRLGRLQQSAWKQALLNVPEGGSVLVISHGRVIEAGLVTCLPDGDFASWGEPFGHGEGARLSFDGGQFELLALRREPQVLEAS